MQSAIQFVRYPLPNWLPNLSKFLSLITTQVLCTVNSSLPEHCLSQEQSKLSFGFIFNGFWWAIIGAFIRIFYLDENHRNTSQTLIYALSLICHLLCNFGNLLIIRTGLMFWGARWQSGNTLISHLWGRSSVPGTASSGKAGSCLPLVSSLQYRTLTNCMYWFSLPFQLPIVI